MGDRGALDRGCGRPGDLVVVRDPAAAWDGAVGVLLPDAVRSPTVDGGFVWLYGVEIEGESEGGAIRAHYRADQLEPVWVSA
jgi:hypothetical protein